jgi:hypothetical protein
MAFLRDLPLSADEQTHLLDYQERWRTRTRSTTPLDRPAVEAAITAVYALLERPKPRVVFHDSPKSVYLYLLSLIEFRVGALIRDELGELLGNRLESRFDDCFNKQLKMHLTDNLLGHLRSMMLDKTVTQADRLIGCELGRQLQFFQTWLLGWSLIGDQSGGLFDMLLKDQKMARVLHRGFLSFGTMTEGFGRISQAEPFLNFLGRGRLEVWYSDLGSTLYGDSFADVLGCIRTTRWVQTAECFDFCTEVLGTPNASPQGWQAFSALVSTCAWIWPFERVVLVSARPEHFRLDSKGLPHAIGEPAIAFTDGFCVFANHGTYHPPSKV